jgi:hypothetical protein
VWTGWLTDQEIVDNWPDAPESDFMLSLLNESAIAACTAFAPEIDTYVQTPDDGLSPGEHLLIPPAPTTVPANFKHAQLIQVRNLWNASRVDPNGSTGQGDFAVTPFPLDWQVKALLRPNNPRWVVG